ncbi:MAG TPA: N-acetylneuraminate synthase family protein [Anaerolineales bacterium]|nr:N-acetylneuraminate synthase family protein [Anaerolineales bacterium]
MEVQPVNIAGREIRAGQPCFIVAEISGNHNGDFQRALNLIQAASWAGATAVKFQAFTMDEILALRGTGCAPSPWEDLTLPQLYAKVITPAAWFPALFAEAIHRGLVPFSSVFGTDSLVMLERLHCPAYKIAKPDRDQLDLLRAVHATGKPVLVSGRDVYCPGGYPCKHEELRLAKLSLSWLGLSCHCPDPLVGPLAVAYGAHYLEVHLTLDDGIPTMDDCVNFTTSQFAEMVRLVQKAEAMR